MAAELFYLPFPTAFTSNGLPAAGAGAYFFFTGTTDPADTYTTSSLTTVHAHPVVANSAGHLPPIYLDNTVTYKLVIRDRNGVQLGSTIDPYYPGASSAIITIASGVVSVSSRSALAALSAVDGQGVYLSESGRAGDAVFSTADLSTEVANDPNQGVYVAPTSDTDGSSGAWKVVSESPLVPQRFYEATDPDFAPAMQRSIAFLKATAVNDLGFNLKASDRLRVPAGDYTLTSDPVMDITHTLIVEGEGGGMSGGGACRLRGGRIRIQRKNTSGASTYDAVNHFGGDGTIIRGLWLDGAFISTESEEHGIHAKARCTIEDCIITGFPGDGIYSNAVAGSANATEGNANNSIVNRVTATSCRRGMFVDGADTNAWLVTILDASNNRQAGIYDSSFLGNSYYACHAASNAYGNFGNGTSTPVTLVSHGGNYYSLALGGNADVAPSGTAIDTVNWLYVGPGAPFTTAPAWATGLNVRSGGPYMADNNNGRSVFSGCYSESGQPISQIEAPSIVLGGQHGAGVSGSGIYMRSNSTGELQFGYERGQPRNHVMALHSTGAENYVQFYSCPGDGTRTLMGYISANSTTGLAVYDLNGNKVLGARKTGWATATGTATRTAFDTATVTLPQLAERLKALIDDLHGTQIGT